MAWWPFGKKKEKEEEIVEDSAWRMKDDDYVPYFMRKEEEDPNTEDCAPAEENTEADAVESAGESAAETLPLGGSSSESAASETQSASAYIPETPLETVNSETLAAPVIPEVSAPVETPAPVSPEYGESAETSAEEKSEELTEETAEDTEEAPEEKKKGFFSLFSKKEKDNKEPEDKIENNENAEEEDEAEKAPKKKGFFTRLKEGLAKTRDNFVYSLDIIFDGAAAIDDDFYEELEEILIMGDIGVRTTETILDTLKEQVASRHIVRPSECKELLIQDIREQMQVGKTAYAFEEQQSVVFVIGVNGVGKTTSIGKIASHLKAQGKKVMMAAADTFRAAAGDQLKVWSERAGVELIGGKEGADPSSVLFDAVAAAKSRHVDVLLVDTAGRLNNKKNLMEELKKMNRVIDREFPAAHRENLIVLDATTGQNALQQARDFNDVADLSGIILTKMDGTAKGGIAVAIQSELQVPVKYIGVGEHIEDLQKFDPDAFVEALFDVKPEEKDTGNADNADA